MGDHSLSSTLAPAPLADSDRRIIAAPATKQLRAQLSAALGPWLSHLPSVLASGTVPSYVADAMRGLMSAFEQWARDETDHA